MGQRKIFQPFGAAQSSMFSHELCRFAPGREIGSHSTKERRQKPQHSPGGGNPPPPQLLLTRRDGDQHNQQHDRIQHGGNRQNRKADVLRVCLIAAGGIFGA